MSLQRSDFAAFFAAVRPGQQPFAWQQRLVDHLVDQGCWPDRLVAPTGTGKTAVVDVHVFVNALGGAGAAPRLPRRLSVVVDRRVVVDSHDEHARRIRDLLAEASEGVLAAVADGLQRLRPEVDRLVDPAPAPLITARLRGGSPPPRSWRDAPEACEVIVATPDMWGSRLLLGGYGASRRSWPREAGLLAYDNVLVVDEAHLSRQLLHTARRVRQLLDVCATPLPVPRLQVVETTATPSPADQGASTVGVDAADLDGDHVLHARLTRPKPVALLPIPLPLPARGPVRAGAVTALTEEVQKLHNKLGGTVGCVVNRVATAVDVAVALRARGLRVETLVGRLRPADVWRLPQGLLTVEGAAGVDVLVATQTVEVGVDLDFTGLVTELATGAALAQRAGRVNRLGLRAEGPVIIAVPDAPLSERAETLPYAVADLEAAHTWLQEVAADADGLAPWRLRRLAPPSPTLARVLLQRPELADTWQWACTSDEHYAEPDLQLWLADDLDPDLDAGLVVRRGLPTDAAEALPLLRSCPPAPHEVFPVRLGDALRIVEREGLSGYLVRAGTPEELSVAGAVRPGDIVVLADDVPLLRGGVVAADGSDAAADVYEDDPRRAHLRLGAASRLDPAIEPDPGVRAALDRVLGSAGQVGEWTLLAKAQLARELSDLADLLPRRLVAAAVRRAALLLRDGRARESEVRALPVGDAQQLIVVDRRRAAADEDLRQTWTTHDRPVPLSQHQQAVAARARLSAEALGLPASEVRALELAGLHHDDGKIDPRFQRMLTDIEPGQAFPAGTSPHEPLAKSGARTARAAQTAIDTAALPRGWRHEQLSVLLADRALDNDPQHALAVRLTGTTHGHGRSGFPHSAEQLLHPGDPLLARARQLFDVGEWDELVDATDREYGVWGCAYLEAVLRAADGRVSGAGS